MRLLILSIIFQLLSSVSTGNNFEGVIKMQKSSQFDVTYYTYYVKNRRVRIEIADKDKVTTHIYLAFLSEKQLLAFSLSQKLFTEIDLSVPQDLPTTEVEVIKTENSRTITGEVCQQWRVRDEEQNTEVAFWVVNNEFYFFHDLLEMLSHIDDTFDYFIRIQETQGFFPMEIVTRTILRKEKNRFLVTSIKVKTVPDSMFSIPNDFDVVKK